MEYYYVRENGRLILKVNLVMWIEKIKRERR